MKHVIRLILLGVLLAVVAAPALAQDEGENIVVNSTFGASGPVNFNPITRSTADEADVVALMFPNLLAVDPETALIQPGLPGAVAESWDVSEDGTVYTFHLRDDFTWSDGTPVTAHDFEFTWDAVVSGETETPLAFITENITDVRAVDDFTLEVTFPSASCEALNDAGIQPYPRQTLGGGDAANPNFAAINESNFDNPDDLTHVGPYRLGAQRANELTAMVPSENPWPDDPVQHEGYVLRLVPDQTVQIEQFLAGESDVIDFVPPNRQADFRAASETGDIAIYEFNPSDTWDYIAFNQANPDNPQEAYDEEGNLVEQDPHPIFADVRVRQALSMALDVDAIIEGAVFGEGTRMHSSASQGTWFYDEDVPFYEFDQEAAGALLEEAGWTDEDGDGIRECHGCMHAEEGTPLEFTMFTNQGNIRREAIGQIAQDQWGQVGARVNFQTIDFNQAVELLDAQTFDAIILGWRNSYPPRADDSQLFATTSDTFGGSNAMSWINPEVDALYEQALFLPGCDPAERAEIYGQIQQIMHDEAPYVFLYTTSGMYAWNPSVEGVSPYPGTLYWNQPDWIKSAAP